MFSLEELDKNNYEELSKLKISKDQKNFVKDFAGCVSYQKENPFLRIYGIKKDDTFIGVTAFARWDNDLTIPIEERLTWFDEFFLDVHYQHLGYGKVVVPMILEKIKEFYNPKFILLSVRNDNPGAIKLYKELGFIATNYIYYENDDLIKERKEILPTDEFLMYKNV